jgi:hypothetical protein
MYYCFFVIDIYQSDCPNKWELAALANKSSRLILKIPMMIATGNSNASVAHVTMYPASPTFNYQTNDRY